MSEQRIIPAGWGYWDITYYPYGGCFRRASKQLHVVVTERGIGKHKDESRVIFTDGRVGVVKSSCLLDNPTDAELDRADAETEARMANLILASLKERNRTRARAIVSINNILSTISCLAGIRDYLTRIYGDDREYQSRLHHWNRQLAHHMDTLERTVSNG